jgi:hypothetical protein
MKKLKNLVILFITILVVTGCDNDNGKELLDEAFKNMENVKSVAMVMEISMGNEQYNMSMKVDGKYDSNEKKSYFETTASLFGMAVTTKTYTVEKDDKEYAYSTEDGNIWTYTISDSNNKEGAMNEVTSATKYAKEYKSVKKVKSDLKGHTKLEVIIAKDTMNNLMSETGESNSVVITNDLVMYVYVKDGYVTKIDMDLSNVIDSANMGGFTKYSMVMTMSDHNKIEAINIPEDAIKNATLKEDEE